MDVLDFNLLASGRITPAEARAQSTTDVQGDPRVIAWALENTSVVY
jgi:hypothetical protein